ncbi:MAG: hypothetical protein ISR83_03300 [Candidatus Marinimicrobia bacterium]|nr:hypothetical protein [Candidatus Neomarinimicrobiota bacterium]
MPEKNTDQPQVDPQKQMLVSKFGDLMEKVGDGYGGPLQTELINRLEQTIADFHEEVTEMIDTLKDNSERRHEKLKEIWNQEEVAESAAPVAEETNTEESSEASSGDMSAWEKRLETLEGDGDKKEEKPAPKDKPKKKKKGLFGRKKK